MGNLSINIPRAGATLLLLLLAACAGTPPADNRPVDERELLVYAILGDIEGARAMMADGADLGVIDFESGNGLLAYAAASGSNEFLQFMIDNHLDVNHRNYNGITPLMLAVSAGNYEGIRILAQHGADLDLENYSPGFTAYMLADSNDDATAMQLLRELGARVCERCRLPAEL